MEKFSDTMKRIVMAGIGVFATTSEKARELLDDLVKKGEITVEQSKALRDEMKRNAEEKKMDKKIDSMAEVLRGMTPEQLAYLKEQLEKVEAEEEAESEDEEAEEDAE